LFASRGDDSGTHKTELSLWRAAGVDVAAASDTWYREMGAGMGATLNSAAEGQGAIADFRLDGKQLFVPNAGKN
jgi:tungstate transport system substrate-binding protein